MGKHGPCYHCGVTSTLLWRNGPPDKPVLCNACGSRWRTKGSLMNYTPRHCLVESAIDEENGQSHRRSTSLNKQKNVQHHNRIQNEENSNKSSSGSSISDADAWLERVDASDLTGSSRSVIVWESMEPPRKRTCVRHANASSIEKLSKDLHAILQEQQFSSCFSCTSDEDLLLEREAPTGSVEIGHGTILIRHLNESAREDYKDIKTPKLLKNQTEPADVVALIAAIDNGVETDLPLNVPCNSSQSGSNIS